MTAATALPPSGHGYVRRTLPVDAVTEHLEELAELGATVRGIADAAGVTPSVVSRLLTRQQARIRPDTARRLLNVSIETVIARPMPTGFVPVVGSRRRIAALLALGWRHADITAHAGGIQSGVVLHQVGDLVTRTTHDAIAAVYDQLSMTLGPSERTRRRARAAGHLPPLAWDDDTLDRLNSSADQLAVSDDTRTTHRIHDLIEDTAWMAASGTTLSEAARRLYLAPASLTRQLERAGHTDLVRALRSNEA